jgi:GntR family transcriptional regulator, transcriptional repressor for pyruvate dehydrogenase complex
VNQTPEPPPAAVHADAFQELDRRTLAHEAAEHLKQLIVDGTLQPGDKLPPERELSGRLGVSRPTLREAVRALVIMGLLESRHGSGTFVAHGTGDAGAAVSITINLHDPLESLFELRLLLEPVATERAASYITHTELGELHRLFQSMERHVFDPQAFIQMDADFHRQIHVAARSPFMLSILDGIAELAMRGRRLSGRQPGTTERTVAEHQIILEALERRDPFEARGAMTAHLMHIRGTLIGQTT